MYCISTFVFPEIGLTTPRNVQTEFDVFYDTALRLLNHFYPEHTITVTSRDPRYITPHIKAKLRKKNRLMRAGQTEKASALALRIGKDIVNRNQTRLSRINSKTSTKDLWAAVRQFTGRPQSTGLVDNVSADSLNQHYASISSDSDYQPPQRKHTAPMERLHQQFASEWQVFSLLDKLSATATGLDQLPAWFLRIGTPLSISLSRACSISP